MQHATAHGRQRRGVDRVCACTALPDQVESATLWVIVRDDRGATSYVTLQR
ncbi:MAG TPA: hypothetical protein VFX59_26865 [Polyangiales bacterium]|nr:hypothetical protein [Polyangiales bacterium]